MKEEFELYENAKRRVIQKRFLYAHSVCFFIGSIILISLEKLFEINLIEITDWSYYTIYIWFILLALHYINVFITKRFMGKNWENNQIEKLVAKQEDRIKEITLKFEREAQFEAESKFAMSQEKINPKNITIIAAIAKNNALGKDNDLIWNLPADLKRFKEITTGHHIIMGRKTFESIGKPLPNRTTIIITRNPDYEFDGCIVVNSLNKAFEAVKNDNSPFIIGGAQIYKEALKFANKLDITEVHEEFDADAFFPKIDLNVWSETKREDFKSNGKNKYDYSFVSYKRA